MKRMLQAALFCATVLLVAQVAGRAGVGSVQHIADAITVLDIGRAQQLLDQLEHDSPALSFERARLAIYRGDCDTAAAILSAPTYSTTKEGAALGRLARSCAGATAGSVIVHVEKHGVWIRLQDEADRVLVPFIVEVAAQARKAAGTDLGVDLPRPLRLEIVRDVFSLSAVSGLPVKAAETTGTVAVARWGRVCMISPRAAPHGYPWEDTLAHEIMHLVITRASGDHAPLWLQEGIAKRQERRWRPKRPFDESAYDEIARAALVAGQSVGIEKLGPSIAMLPSAEAARIAYAEVSSFMAYWIEQNGEPALRLLLADLKGIGSADANAAMRSATGYQLGVWRERWKRDLLSATGQVASGGGGGGGHTGPGQAGAGPGSRARIDEAVRRVRLGDMLFDRGHSPAAAAQFDQAVASADREAAVRWRASRALCDTGQHRDARDRIGDLTKISGAHGPWFALRGRFLREDGNHAAAERSFVLGIALDPLAEDVACEGHWRPRSTRGEPAPEAHLPASRTRRALCQGARLLNGQD